MRMSEDGVGRDAGRTRDEPWRDRVKNGEKEFGGFFLIIIEKSKRIWEILVNGEYA